MMYNVKVIVFELCVTLAAVFVGVAALLSRHWLIRRWTGPELSDHLHHIGHDHLTGAHRFEPFGQRSVWVFFNVDLRFNCHRSPAARRVDCYLLKLRAKNTFNNCRKYFFLSQEISLRTWLTFGWHLIFPTCTDPLRGLLTAPFYCEQNIHLDYNVARGKWIQQSQG